MLVAKRFVLRGRVQGVGFRFFTERAAGQHGIHGWVTNRADGAVEVFAEGEREAVRQFEAQLRRGPDHAQVDDVWVDDDVPTGRMQGFAVRG